MKKKKQELSIIMLGGLAAIAGGFYLVYAERFTETEDPIAMIEEQEVAATSGSCMQNKANLDEDLYLQVKQSFSARHPSFHLSFGNGYGGTIGFYCKLDNGNHLVTMVYSDHAAGKDPSDDDVKIVLFDSAGQILKETDTDLEEPFGEYTVGGIKDGVLKYNIRTIDACYDSTDRYTLDLNTFAYNGTHEGGDTPNCQADI